MKNQTLDAGTRNGATLVVVLGVMLLSFAVVASVFFSIGSRVRQAYMQIYMEQAFYLAEAGMERAAAYVADNETDATLTGTLGAGSYQAIVSCQSLPGGEVGIEVYSTGTVHNVSRGVTVRGLRKVSWARYAFWYDKEALTLSMAPGDSFKGWFYARPLLRFSNSGLAQKGKVHFYDKAWTAQDHYTYDLGAEPICDKGLKTSAEIQTMATVDFAILKAGAVTSGLVLDGDATITLQGTKMWVTCLSKGWNNKEIALIEDGIVYAQAYSYTETYYDSRGRKKNRNVVEPGDINISAPNGVQGRLTLVAERDINIDNHVRYTSNPQINPDSTDALGLIAQRSVVVTEAAPNDLDIYAHILCKDGGFGVYNYDKGSPRGMLNVYGGIANQIRNAVALINQTGYLKNYSFDPRFIRNPPPYYPKLDDELEWGGWEG